MLTEVLCDKFIKDGKERGPIRFHEGLNVVLGDDNGSNSIGKSTFLMILDFVFGGNDYVNKCVDVQENVKGHTICFAFDFSGEKYYFARNTIKHGMVLICDENYNPIPNTDPLTIEQYGLFLCDKYGLNAEGATWRGSVSRFIRVYKRDTLDEEHPLRSSKNEPSRDAIKNYMRTLDRYAAVEAQIKQAEQANDEKDTFRKSREYNYIRSAKNKKEKDANEKRIQELKVREQELSSESEKGVIDLDSMKARQITALTEQLIAYRREKAEVQTQLNNVRRDMQNPKKSFKRTFTDLERFFPEESFKELEEIEHFHQRLSKILTEEFKQMEADLATTFVMLNNEIVKIKDQITELENIPNVSKAILEEYAVITTELNNLEEANKNYDEYERLKQVAAQYEATRDAVIKDQLQKIESDVNLKMRDITYEILKDRSHLPPMLRMEGLNKYVFNTPNDGGTGAQYRGLITFDLANMAIAPIPFIVHDSVLLKNIERAVFSEIMKSYDSQKSAGKQVFVAYDTLDQYSKKTQELIRDNSVLELTPGGGELFGWAWNKEGAGDDEE